MRTVHLDRQNLPHWEGSFFTLSFTIGLIDVFSEENPNGLESMVHFFEPGSSIAKVTTTGYEGLDEIGLDTTYRRATLPINQYFMRGHWVDDHTFMIEWAPIGNTGTAFIELKYSGDSTEIRIQSLIFGGEATVIKGTR